MSKILTIMSSPREQGNTELLLESFLKGIQKTNKHTIDLVMLRDKTISPCLELYGCKQNGRCIIDDDFNELYDKLESCDRLVIATPIFFFAFPAQLKAVIDRCQSFYVRKYLLDNPILKPEEARRPCYLLALGGSNDKQMLMVAELVLKYFLLSLDMKLEKTLVYRGIDAKGDIFKHPTALADVYQLGASL